MPQARRGSILFTAVGMVAVFLTLVVGSTAYVESATKQSENDRWRDTAEQAARSGLEWVMGYAQANIDAENRLPRAWSQLQDGDIINPVAQWYYNTAGVPKEVDDVNTLAVTDPFNTTKGVGTILGSGSAPETGVNGVGEYILSRQGNYIVTFKARVQQYSYGDMSPRQFRIGVVGRVRHAVASGATKKPGTVNTDERPTIVAERLITSNFGQEPTSRYAALIDIDGVKNWVPGEVVNGPLHINRGYIDSQIETTDSTSNRTGTVFRALGIASASFFGQDVTTGAGTVKATQLRSLMNLRTSQQGAASWNTTGSPFQRVYDPEINGGTNLDGPRFNDEVTITAVPASTANAKKYQITNFDPYNTTNGLCNDAADTTQGVAVEVDGKTYCASTIKAAGQTAIFQAPENQRGDDSFGTANKVTACPNVLDYPISLPHSVRNRLGSALGAGAPLTSVKYWDSLPDGVYVPTSAWWSGANVAQTDLSGQTVYDSSGAGAYPATGGIYVRGNVEVMRMGQAAAPNDNLSYYMFILGYGGPYNAATNPKRAYLVVADRASNAMRLFAFDPSITDSIPGLGKNAGDAWLCKTPVNVNQNLFMQDPIANSPTSPGGWGFGGGWTGPDTSIDGFKITGTGNHWADFKLPAASNQQFPFNGVVFIDMSQLDWARMKGNPGNFNNVPPLTGNIFSLGDPGTHNAGNDPALGAVSGLPAAKRALDGVTDERVATFQGTNPKNPASSLTILTTGNIFIQNSLTVSSLKIPAITRWPGFTFSDADKITLDISHDLLGLVADKQVVLGLAAPNSSASRSSGNRSLPGVVIHAAIAALGDPAYDYVQQQADPKQFVGMNPYRGSFATEGLMGFYNVGEEYYTCCGGPNSYFGAAVPAALSAKPANAPAGSAGAIAASLGGGTRDMYGYPGIPLYQDWSFPFAGSTVLNPNGVGTRGRALVFGSVTMKKRGIIGKGDTSYDKRFLFDHRLLTIAPPVFPSSTNIVLRTAAPVTPQGLPYQGVNGGTAPDKSLQFML